MVDLIGYFKEQTENNMELFISYNDSLYHLSYDDDDSDNCYVFNQDTGTICYEGKICDILDNFIIDDKTFRELLLSEAIEITI